mmetsp:Transcript_42649/g.103150  ORF Transcript_42649/g.103150 Transcript_42649/m.103150 type:complete len:221 (-) Transcript_42649:79-741(-)
MVSLLLRQPLTTCIVCTLLSSPFAHGLSSGVTSSVTLVLAVMLAECNSAAYKYKTSNNQHKSVRFIILIVIIVIVVVVVTTITVRKIIRRRWWQIDRIIALKKTKWVAFTTVIRRRTKVSIVPATDEIVIACQCKFSWSATRVIPVFILPFWVVLALVGYYRFEDGRGGWRCCLGRRNVCRCARWNRRILGKFNAWACTCCCRRRSSTWWDRKVNSVLSF